MSTYTAVIGDTRSIGVSVTNTLTGSGQQRLNPAVAAARIRSLQNPHIVSSAIGGFISADFTVPPEEAQLWRPALKYGAVCWLFDGQTPIFMGYLEKPTWAADGSCVVTVSGPWTLWQRERFREAWDVWDMSLFEKGGVSGIENKAGQMTLNGDQTLTLSIPNGSTMAASDRVSATFLLFGEVVGAYDDKLITAFDFNISDQQNLGANFRCRVIGAVNATANGDQLWDSGATTGASGIQGAYNIHGTNQSGGWPNQAGYRCLRFEIVTLVARTPLGNDTSVTFDRIRVSTRESVLTGVGSPQDTAVIARDVINARPSPTVQEPLINEFWLGSVGIVSGDGNTTAYSTFGGGAVGALNPTTGTGTAPNSGVGVHGFSALEWQAPTDVLTQLAGVDACHVGFYLPYNGRSGYDPPGASSIDVGSWWLSAPPQLFYQAFPDPVYAPDYTVHVRDGAVVEQDPNPQPLVDQAYVNYNTRRGHQLSEVQVDADLRNYLYAQGYRRSEDWTLQTPVGDNSQAHRLGQQQMTIRRQPYTGATITIRNDDASRYPIRKAGTIVAKLATVRPGSVRIVGAPSGGGLQAGFATQVEWWGQTLTEPETLQITLGQPGEPPRRQAHGHLVNRTMKTRRAVLR